MPGPVSVLKIESGEEKKDRKQMSIPIMKRHYEILSYDQNAGRE
jgi:hypothetical protein